MAGVKKLLSVVGACSCLAVTAACGSVGSGGGSEDGKIKIAAVTSDRSNQFYQDMIKGMEDAAKENGAEITVQSATSASDSSGQADLLGAMNQQDFDCYIASPVSVDNLVRALAPVAQRDVPIVNLDLALDPEATQRSDVTLDSFIASNHSEAGQLAADHMMGQLETDDQVVVVGGPAGDSISRERISGFVDAVEGDLDVVQTVAADWNRDKAYTTAVDILRARPDVKGFFAANDDMALGILRAAEQAGRDDVRVIGVDGVPDAFKSIRDGGLAATVTQYPFVMGRMGVEACLAAARGETVPETAAAPQVLVTADNISDIEAKLPEPVTDYDDPFAG